MLSSGRPGTRSGHRDRDARLRLVEKCVSAQNSIDRLLEKFNVETVAELEPLYTEIDGITRFPSVRQCFSYSRLVPGADNSGGRTRHRSGSKAGNRYLKLAFSHAGIRAVQYYPEIRAFFKAKARRKPIRIARTLVALELARIVSQVLAKQEAFNGQFKHHPLSRGKHAQWPRRASPPV